jgi:hypothetical protein
MFNIAWYIIIRRFYFLSLCGIWILVQVIQSKAILKDANASLLTAELTNHATSSYSASETRMSGADKCLNKVNTRKLFEKCHCSTINRYSLSLITNFRPSKTRLAQAHNNELTWKGVRKMKSCSTRMPNNLGVDK